MEAKLAASLDAVCAKRTTSQALDDKASKAIKLNDSSSSSSTGVDYLSNLPTDLLRYGIQPFLAPFATQTPLPHHVEPADPSIFRREAYHTVSRRVSASVMQGVSRRMEVFDSPKPVLSKQYLAIFRFVERWCEARKDLLVDFNEVGENGRVVGFAFVKEVLQLEKLGLGSAPSFPTHKSFLKQLEHIRARDEVWRKWLGMDNTAYDAAVAGFRFDMDQLHKLDKRTRSEDFESGWVNGFEVWNGHEGKSVSPFEAVLQLYVGRGMRCAEDYFRSMMWSLTCHFGARVAWIVSSSLLWFGEYSHRARITFSMASKYAHIAQVLIGKDLTKDANLPPSERPELLAAERELYDRRGEDDGDTDVFGEMRYNLWRSIEIIEQARTHV